MINNKEKRYLDRKVNYAIEMHNEGYSWNYIWEDLYMELSYEGTIDGSTIEVYVDLIIRWAKDVVMYQI